MLASTHEAVDAQISKISRFIPIRMRHPLRSGKEREFLTPTVVILRRTFSMEQFVQQKVSVEAKINVYGQ